MLSLTYIDRKMGVNSFPRHLKGIEPEPITILHLMLISAYTIKFYGLLKIILLALHKSLKLLYLLWYPSASEELKQWGKLAPYCKTQKEFKKTNGIVIMGILQKALLCSLKIICQLQFFA